MLTVTDCVGPVTGSAAPASADCVQLERLSALYSRPVRSTLPAPDSLDPLLADINQEEEGKSLWEMFSGWWSDRLREFWEALPDFPNPLGDLEWTLPAWLAEVSSWAGLVLIGLLVVLVLVVLWRVPGIRSALALRRVISAVRPRRGGSTDDGRPSFADLQSAPPAQRPRILLALVIGALRSAGRLRGDAALSHRQLGPAVREVTPGQRVAIESLAALAERVTYSQFVPDAGELDDALAASHELVAGLTR